MTDLETSWTRCDNVLKLLLSLCSINSTVPSKRRFLSHKMLIQLKTGSTWSFFLSSRGTSDTCVHADDSSVFAPFRRPDPWWQHAQTASTYDKYLQRFISLLPSGLHNDNCAKCIQCAKRQTVATKPGKSSYPYVFLDGVFGWSS